MSLLQDFDLAVFRWMNRTCAHPALDVVMRLLSGEYWMWGLAIALIGWGLYRGGKRVRCFLTVLAVVLAIGEGLITGPAKKFFQRPRPFVTHIDTRLPPGTGKGTSYSLPSGHAAAIAALAMTAGIFYPRTRRALVPLAFGVGVSRIYNGVHYPTDVMAGWATGMAYAWLIAQAMQRTWKSLGRRWFPIWWANTPDVLEPEVGLSPVQRKEMDLHSDPNAAARQWLRLGIVVIVVLMVSRWGYQAARIIDLSEDEAYQWVWSKHLDWSYYSKPPGIALAQRLGTLVAGDTELGVRFLSPLISALVSWMTLRFLARFVAAEVAFWAVLAFNAVPLFALGGLMLTVDPLTVFFWTLAMLAGWRAVVEDSTRWWGVVGLGLAGEFLCKYFSPFHVVSLAIVMGIWPRARRQLRRPGPWVALGINLLAVIPVWVWNVRHGDAGLVHLAERGALKEGWRFTLRYFNDFMIVEPILFNPFFFAALVIAVVVYIRRPSRLEVPSAFDPDGFLIRYLFAMGAPVFLFYFAYTFRGRVQPNWIASSVLPLLLFAVVVGSRIQRGSGAGRWMMGLYRTGFVVVFPLLILAHETNWVAKFAGQSLPPNMEPLRRMRGFREVAAIVSEQYARVAASGRPTYILCHHYGYAGELSFYLPAARARVGTPEPLVYVRRFAAPNNQFWFWPEYEYRNKTGADFLLVFQSDEPLVMPVEELRSQFVELEDLGEFPALYRGREFHRLRLFIGHGLR